MERRQSEGALLDGHSGMKFIVVYLGRELATWANLRDSYTHPTVKDEHSRWAVARCKQTYYCLTRVFVVVFLMYP